MRVSRLVAVIRARLPWYFCFFFRYVLDFFFIVSTGMPWGHVEEMRVFGGIYSFVLF